jgi:dihydroneopterin aldolase
MDALMEIELQKVRLYGYHGVDEAEQIVGGEFEINLITHYKPIQLIVCKMEETVDYKVLLELVKLRMQRPALLLETLATEIAGEIIWKFSCVTAVEISISKLHPPIENFRGSVGVTYKFKR